MRRLFLIIGLMLIAQLSRAQVKFGVYIDPQYTWLTPETRDAVSEGGYFGLNGGLSIDNYFAKNYALATGIGLGTQGGSIKYSNEKTIMLDNNQDTTLAAGSAVDYKLQYITVPVGLKLRSNQIGYITFYANIGVTNQFNINAKASSSDGVLQNDPIRKEINWYNLAYHFGGGIEYAISEDTALNFALIYHNGFLDVTHSDPRINSRVLTIRVGVLF